MIPMKNDKSSNVINPLKIFAFFEFIVFPSFFCTTKIVYLVNSNVNEDFFKNLLILNYFALFIIFLVLNYKKLRPENRFHWS